MAYTKEQEQDVYVLCAGHQRRHTGNQSKFMVPIEGKPAFFHTMQSILKVFPEERVTVIVSNIFPDFPDYVISAFSKSKVAIDEEPGKGTAHSLSITFPWQTSHAFVSEGDIYYSESLILDQLEALRKQQDAQAILSVTNKINIAPSHRAITLEPSVQIAESNTTTGLMQGRNVGAYTLRNDVEVHLKSIPNVIDAIRKVNGSGGLVIALAYLDVYLHMASIDDHVVWESYSNNHENKI
jgi:NDP-sugar pyrophosphorylase family protein